MKSELEGDKRAMTRIWSQHEKCIENVTYSAAGMDGDLQGIEVAPGVGATSVRLTRRGWFYQPRFIFLLSLRDAFFATKKSSPIILVPLSYDTSMKELHPPLNPPPICLLL